MASNVLHRNNGWGLSYCINSPQTDIKMLAHKENTSFKCSWGFFELLTFAFITTRAQKVSSAHHHWYHNFTLTADNTYKTLERNNSKKRYVVLCFKIRFVHVNCLCSQNLKLNKMIIICFPSYDCHVLCQSQFNSECGIFTRVPHIDDQLCAKG